MGRMSLALFGLVTALWACADDGPSATTSKPACNASTGTLQGTIRLAGTDIVIANAVAAVRRTPGDAPLFIEADELGAFAATIAEGTWLVNGQDGDYCATLSSMQVDVVACATTTVDLALDCVLGGGGAGGMR